ncbi:MAG TPA: UTP--glucose-1-phosphate uridylyltransferase [Candidatus Acidoferrales bacterium]|nr:UTP--glucose-1-phosphate uridylyltransferase [Candidatus Acidoferrales bacterium]
MTRLVAVITAQGPERDLSLDALCGDASLEGLLAEARDLDLFRRSSDNLYQRVRALFFLYSIHRFHIPLRSGATAPALIPFAGYTNLLKRRFEEALDIFLAAQSAHGPSAAISSALAAAYRSLGFQTLADQVRQSVRSVRGNQWMFRAGHPDDCPLRLHPELLAGGPAFPILHEATPVRMDLTHSGWSDIFFLGMDFPEGARVLNVSIDLAIRGAGSRPAPPVEAFLRVIDEPVLRLTSVDLQASAAVTSVGEVFDFARDYLGLLKAAVIASGIVPPGMEGATQPLSDLLAALTGRHGHGIEIVSRVNDIPKGSRLAVSTSLLACLIAVCMRATGQIRTLAGGLEEHERRLVAARAILGEWLGGSGGGWQDSGGVWPGIKLIHGVAASDDDPEFGISRGRLLPDHKVYTGAEVPQAARDALQQSLVLVHGGMAQDVGPILEMVTEKYLLRSATEWNGRLEAIAILDEVVGHLQHGDIAAIGACTQKNFDGPIQTIIPWAGNLYTDTLIRRAREEFGRDFLGFWMLGGMSGGGMGFLFAPARKPEAEARMQAIMSETRRAMEHAVPFAMEPVVYQFAINERGTWSTLQASDDALMPAAYYTLTVPSLVRSEARHLTPARRSELERFAAACRIGGPFSGMAHEVFDHLMPRAAAAIDGRARSLESLLEAYGFDRAQHEQIQADLRSGRIGLAQNRLPVTALIEDAHPDACDPRHRDFGMQALAEGRLAVVTLAGGVGSRWTKGAGVVKALNPFCKLGGRHRNFIEVHLAKSLRTGRLCGQTPPHVVTTSYLTHDAIAAHAFDYPGTLLLSQGRSIGLRMIPTERDLRFAWEEMPQQLLDERAQKVREGLHAALIKWAKHAGEASNYTDNLPMQCLHPVGHWYEIPNLLRNGILSRLLADNPRLRYLLVHNIDTVGADPDPALLGQHIATGAAITTEVVARHLEDRGGGLALVDGRSRLVEGLALPSEEVESRLSYYNSATYWIDIEQLLAVFQLRPAELDRTEKVNDAVRAVAARMPTYITLKDVKKRWGKGQEDVFPVAQFEKLWGDMTTLPDLDCRFIAVPRVRGQQLKEPAQLDAWLRDGSAAHVESLCDFAR